MRIPLHHSPSSLGLWLKDRREYYLKYLCETRAPRIPQTHQMAIGSAFDSYVKNHIAAVLGCCGDALHTPAESPYFTNQFLASVEPHNRDRALADGLRCFNSYVASGALASLMAVIPRGAKVVMEDTVRGFVPGTTVPLLGKPDLLVETLVETGSVRLILDWKVNGFYSSASPVAGYCDRWGAARGGYKDGVYVKDVATGVHLGSPMTVDWLNQLVTYDWCLGGGGVGTVFVIDQLAWRNGVLTVARHANRAPGTMVDRLAAAYTDLASALRDGRCFTDMTVADDVAEQQRLDVFASGFGTSGTAADSYFNGSCR